MEIEQLITNAKEGHGDPLEAYVAIKAIADAADKGLKELKDLAMNEASKYGKSFARYGAKIELRNAPGRWDYSSIPLIASAEDRVKYLKKLSEIGGVDEETGEVIPKANKTEGSATIAISFK